MAGWFIVENPIKMEPPYCIKPRSTDYDTFPDGASSNCTMSTRHVLADKNSLVINPPTWRYPRGFSGGLPGIPCIMKRDDHPPCDLWNCVALW